MLSRRRIYMGILLLSGLLVSCGVAKKSNSSEDKPDEVDEQSMQNVAEERNILGEAKADNPEIVVAKAQEQTENSAERIMGIADMKKMAAGSVIEVTTLESLVLDDLFYIEEINKDVKDRIYGKSYKENCYVPYEDLRYIRVLHKNFEGKTQIGEMIVNKSIAKDVVDIFKELYDANYPIERMVLVDEYDADDNASMEANNTSAFNFRFIDGTTKRSNHSDGLAIDVNPRYNPYVRTIDGKKNVLPVNGKEYADRSIDNPYYIRKDDICYKAFIKRGFTWGGEWKNSKDYQHFQKDK